MKNVLMLLIVASAMPAIASPAMAQTLAKDGKSDYVIILSQSPLPANARAADELQKHLSQMTGVTLPVKTDSEPLPDHAILIGQSKHLDALGVKLDKEALGNDGFVLKTIGNRLVIAGPGPRGSMYGTYEVLEKLGVRWFTPKVTRLPSMPTLDLPQLDEIQIPSFEYREPFFTEAQEKDWAARNRVIGNAPQLDASTGGTIKYAMFVHTFDALIPPALFDKHPEYFPLVDGKRVNGYVQRCLTNPDVLKLSVDGVKQTFKDHPDAIITSVSQNDVDKWCECDECKKLTAKYGGHSGLYIWFVNQVAEQIEKEMPDKLIDTLAYQFTESPPAGIAPRKNVRVRLCPISVCEAHAYEHDDFPASKAFVSSLAAWSKITDTLYIWHYNTNFANYLMPFPDFDEFPADARLYKRSGVKGIFFQGDYAPGGGGSDAELRSWVMSKLLWNVNVDTDKLVTEWMQGVYGKAFGPMRKWFDLLHEKARDPKQHFGIYVPPTVHYLSDDVLAQGNKLFEEANTLAIGDSIASEYVTKNSIGLRYVKLIHNPTAGPEFTRFMADVRKFGIQFVSEPQSFDAWEKAYLAGIKK